MSLVPVSMMGLKDFHEYAIQPELYRYLEFPPFESLAESRTYLGKLIDRSSAPEAQYWFIQLSENGKIVGSIGLHSFDSLRRSVEIGYGVSPDYWGRGVFKGAAGMLIDYAFEELLLHRIVARTPIQNLASIRGLEGLGFSKEGIMRDYYRHHTGGWWDSVLLSKLSTDK